MADRHQWLKYWIYTLSIFSIGREKGFLVYDNLSSSSRSALADAVRIINRDAGSDSLFSLERCNRGYRISFDRSGLASNVHSSNSNVL